MRLDFRHLARESLKRARPLIASSNEEEVRYGCLELRLCIEYLVLDRFKQYQEYIDDEASRKWTPKKVIEEMLENDPYSDTNATIAVGLEKEYGVASDDMKVLGEDRRLKLKWANENWQALSSFLHSPSLEQLSKGSLPSLQTRRARAAAVSEHLSHVLDARVWGVTGGAIYELACGDCGKVTKRFAASINSKNGFVCRTAGCGATYDVVGSVDGVTTFTMRQLEFTCPKCEQRDFFRAHYFKEGSTLICRGCEKHWTLLPGLFAQEREVRDDQPLAAES
jgi:hypothetical protein